MQTNIRQWITLVEAMSDKPYINAHGNELVWIDMMWVPPDQRGTGVGRRYYEEWEKALPPSVRLIRLMAADAGDGLSNGFWEAMGFEYQYVGEDLDYETSQYMWKGVNGHPTPPSVDADAED